MMLNYHKKCLIDYLRKEFTSLAFFFPVVPRGEARIRVQISASHTISQIDKALNIFNKIGKELNII